MTNFMKLRKKNHFYPWHYDTGLMNCHTTELLSQAIVLRPCIEPVSFYIFTFSDSLTKYSITQLARNQHSYHKILNSKLIFLCLSMFLE